MVYATPKINFTHNDSGQRRCVPHSDRPRTSLLLGPFSVTPGHGHQRAPPPPNAIRLRGQYPRNSCCPPLMSTFFTLGFGGIGGGGGQICVMLVCCEIVFDVVGMGVVVCVVGRYRTILPTLSTLGQQPFVFVRASRPNVFSHELRM